MRAEFLCCRKLWQSHLALQYPIKQRNCLCHLIYGFGFVASLWFLSENAVFCPCTFSPCKTNPLEIFLILAGLDISKYLTPILHELFPPDGYGWARRGVLFSKQWGWQFASCLFAFLLFFLHCIIGIIFQCTKLWNPEAFMESQLQLAPSVLGKRAHKLSCAPGLGVGWGVGLSLTPVTLLCPQWDPGICWSTRSILPRRSRPAQPRPGSLGTGTEGPLCSERQGWRPGLMWIFPISFSQMRPAWRNQCCWSYSSTCESRTHRCNSPNTVRMGCESATRTVGCRLSQRPSPAPGLLQDLFLGPGTLESLYLPTAALSRDEGWRGGRPRMSCPHVCFVTGEVAVVAPRSGQRAWLPPSSPQSLMSKHTARP